MQQVIGEFHGYELLKYCACGYSLRLDRYGGLFCDRIKCIEKMESPNEVQKQILRSAQRRS